MDVPAVLRSGDHGKVATWRRERAIERTRQVRPDLYARWRAAGGEPAAEPRHAAD
jgi:tRNA (guanine-N1)-methyltransferase